MPKKKGKNIKEIEKIEIEIVGNITDNVGISENIRKIDEKEDASKVFFRKASLIIVTLACVVFNFYIFASRQYQILMTWMFIMQIVMCVVAGLAYLANAILRPTTDNPIVFYSKFIHIIFLASTIAVFIYFLSRLVP